MVGLTGLVYNCRGLNMALFTLRRLIRASVNPWPVKRGSIVVGYNDQKELRSGIGHCVIHIIFESSKIHMKGLQWCIFYIFPP
jgi:hypothetical protein